MDQVARDPDASKPTLRSIMKPSSRGLSGFGAPRKLLKASLSFFFVPSSLRSESLSLKSSLGF